MTCQKAQGFLGQTEVKVREKVDATKTRLAGEEALGILTGMDRLIAARGKRVAVFDLKRDRPDDETLLAHLLGPTGNLRAPTLKVGKTVLVGFNEESYRDVLGLTK
jgi:arsenate reductase-like glutaredoxin family protein